MRYWDMAPLEFAIRAHAHARKDEREMYRLAWLASRLLGAWNPKPPTPEQLLGRQMSWQRKTNAPTTED